MCTFHERVWLISNQNLKIPDHWRIFTFSDENDWKSLICLQKLLIYFLFALFSCYIFSLWYYSAIKRILKYSHNKLWKSASSFTFWREDSIPVIFIWFKIYIIFVHRRKMFHSLSSSSCSSSLCSIVVRTCKSIMKTYTRTEHKKNTSFFGGFGAFAVY